MPITNTLSEKITGNILANNLALPKMTTTTLAEAGTNLPSIMKDTNSIVMTSLLKSTGESGQGLYAPIIDMKDFAQKADPVNAAIYGTHADSVITGVDSSVANSLSGLNNSFFDIQKVTKESISTGVDSYGLLINRVNPSISVGATDLGVSKIADMGRLADSSIIGAATAGTSALTANITGINAKILDKAMADKALASSLSKGESILDLPKTIVVVNATTTKAKQATVKGIDEGAPPSLEQNSTDNIYQDVHLFVEGIEMPFDGISITQNIGQLPRASFQVPPNASLMEIVRGYQPKVHIFYTDKNTGGDRLLFWGHIVACNYNYSQQQGGANISFECMHKNALMQQVTIEWSAGTGSTLTGGSMTDTNSEQAAVQINNFNSELTLILALQGITGSQQNDKDLIKPSNKDVSTADVSLLDARFETIKARMVGMPTAMMNLWNQIKSQVYAKEKVNVIFSKVYVPLIEEGIRFFDRLSGHNYLESQIDNGRVDPCSCKGHPETSKHKTMLPPAFRVGIISAVQTQLAINTLKSSLGFSGELMDFHTLFTNFFMGIEYEMLTLASPGEVPVDPNVIVDPDSLKDWNAAEKVVVETIVKPQVPFYYAPICNVLLPNMFNSVQVQQADSDIPTRITVIDTTASSTQDNPNTLGINYRAPQSIRESIVMGRQFLSGNGSTEDASLTLKDTTGSSFNIPGKYEIGRGIHHKKIAMPNWLAHFAKDQDGDRASSSDQQSVPKDSPEGKNIMDLHYAWIQRYGYKNVIDTSNGGVSKVRDNSRDSLDPYSTKAGIMAYERLLFNGADYDYSRSVAGSRNGNVEALFNPYIVPGYPMDIIDGNPNHPSFHAMCASITHSISSRGIGTSIGFVAAVSYAELSNYYSFPIHPWLSTALSMINVERGETLTKGGDTQADQATSAGSATDPTPSSMGLTPDPLYDSNTGDIKSIQQTIINNPLAKNAADKFYRSVFGVGSADPGLLYNFTTGEASPVARINGTWTIGSGAPDKSPRNGGEGNPNLTGVGNLKLVSRPIEGKKSIESKFDIKFVDLTPQNYNEKSSPYANPATTSKQLLEPGASMFLDYEELNTLLKTVNKNE